MEGCLGNWLLCGVDELRVCRCCRHAKPSFVCEGDWLACEVRTIVTVEVLYISDTYNILVYNIRKLSVSITSFSMECRVGFCSVLCVWLSVGRILNSSVGLSRLLSELYTLKPVLSIEIRLNW
jgi:hypothetical protein